MTARGGLSKLLVETAKTQNAEVAAFANSPILDCAHDTPAAQLLDWLFPILVQQSTFSEETLRGAFGYLQKKAEGSNAEGDNLDLYTRVKAVIGFCLLSVVTEKWQTPMIQGDEELLPTLREQRMSVIRRDANAVLDDRAVLELILKVYDVESDTLRKPVTLEFWRTGTSSLILKSADDHGVDLALKIVKFQYLDNERIGRQTAAYGDEAIGLTGPLNAPSVRRKTRRYVLMDFVNGLTLHEYMEELRQLGEPSDRATQVTVAIRVLTKYSGPQVR